MCFDRLRERWVMRKYKRVRVIEQGKRAEPFEPSRLIQPLQVDDIFKWVCSNIKYKPEGKDYWQTPLETLQRGAGDCEDGSILLASLFCSVLPKSERWRVFVAVFEKPAHVVVVYRNRVFDWTNKTVKKVSQISSWKLLYMFNFRSVYAPRRNVKKWLRG